MAKTWSYKTITEKAEKEIRRLMSYDHPLSVGAYGVFILWNDLTMGWQKEGDSDRLEALTKRDA